MDSEIDKKTVETTLKLYGSGGSSSKAIVDTYIVAVEKFRINANEKIITVSKYEKCLEI
ncbi:hypothetical protein [Clostridium beijerinckii]|uniref:hypothetical protein n=1 Tax=Clostridium beijerinckii TaxID=1520 RepID=UPI00242A35F3|nr:hypothetical protein [Clostridium beijerinckii]MDG5855647.1 hypothetical protein [Clostridium beijerinckii]